MTFIFDRCHRSWAEETPAKYERDLKYVTYYCDKSKFFVMEKLTNGALVRAMIRLGKQSVWHPVHQMHWVVDEWWPVLLKDTGQYVQALYHVVGMEYLTWGRGEGTQVLSIPHSDMARSINITVVLVAIEGLHNSACAIPAT